MKSHLNLNDQCYNSTDTINHFLSLQPAMQRLYRDQHIYDFNPTADNADIIGHALVDYAGILVDSLEDHRLEEKEDGLAYSYQEVVDLLNEAYGITDFYAWQIDLYASSLINLALELYQLPQSSYSNTSKDIDKSIISHLDLAISITEDSNHSIIFRHLHDQAIKYKEDIMPHLSKNSER